MDAPSENTAFLLDYSKAVESAGNPEPDVVLTLVADLLADPDRQDIDPALSPLRDFLRAQLAQNIPLNRLTEVPVNMGELESDSPWTEAQLAKEAEDLRTSPVTAFTGLEIPEERQLFCLAALLRKIADENGGKQILARDFRKVLVEIIPEESVEAVRTVLSGLYQRPDDLAVVFFELEGLLDTEPPKGKLQEVKKRLTAMLKAFLRRLGGDEPGQQE